MNDPWQRGRIDRRNGGDRDGCEHFSRLIREQNKVEGVHMEERRWDSALSHSTQGEMLHSDDVRQALNLVELLVTEDHLRLLSDRSGIEVNLSLDVVYSVFPQKRY